MNTTAMICLTVIIVFLLSPFVIYFAAKLWTYGSLRGAQLFEELRTDAIQKQE